MSINAILFKNKYRIPSARLKGWDYSSVGWYYITICTNKDCLFGEVINGVMILNHIGEIVREEWENSFQIRKELICNTYIIMPDHIHGLIGIVKTNDGKDIKSTIMIDGTENIVGDNPYAGRDMVDMAEMLNLLETSNVTAPNMPDIPNATGIYVPVETHGRASLQMRNPQNQMRNPQNQMRNPQNQMRNPQNQMRNPQNQMQLPQNHHLPHRVPRSISSFVAGFKSSATKRINELRRTPGVPIWQPRFYDRIIRDDKGFFAVQKYINDNPRQWWLKSKNQNMAKPIH